MGFKSYPADPDVWLHLALKSHGMPVYDYVLLYTDDTVVISENAESILTNEVGRYFEMSIGPKPSILVDDQTAVNNVEDFVAGDETKR